MRIVHVIGYFQPEFGYEEFFVAREQASAGHEVHVVCSDRIAKFGNISLSERMRPVGQSTIDGITVHRLPTLWEPHSDFILVKGLKNKIKSINPDIVQGHTTTQPPSLIVAFYAKELGYRYFIDNHDFFFLGHPMNPKHHNFKSKVARWEYLTIRRMLSLKALNFAEKVIVMDQACMGHVKNFLGIPSSKIFMNNRAVDTERFTFQKSWRLSLRNQWNLQDNEQVLLFTGNINPRKRIEVLADILNEVRELPLKIVIVGKSEPTYLQLIRDRFIHFGLENQLLIYEGVVSKDMAQYYCAADMAIWIANNSVAIMEAMACRCPVIIPRGQFAELVQNGGIIVEEMADIPAFAEAIRKLVNSSQLRAKMGAFGRNHMVGNFSYRKAAKSLIKLYTS